MSRHIFSLEFKTNLLRECQRVIGAKIAMLSSALSDVMEAANSETKSSAGDKHETARSIMQIEQEKIGRQLSDLNEQKELLNKIPLQITSKIVTGSIVETDKGIFFISCSAGKINLEGKEIMAISPASPIGQKLIGTGGNSFELNQIKYNIISVT